MRLVLGVFRSSQSMLLIIFFKGLTYPGFHHQLGYGTSALKIMYL